jgi:hypothetical protein
MFLITKYGKYICIEFITRRGVPELHVGGKGLEVLIPSQVFCVLMGEPELKVLLSQRGLSRKGS